MEVRYTVTVIISTILIGLPKSGSGGSSGFFSHFLRGVEIE